MKSVYVCKNNSKEAVIEKVLFILVTILLIMLSAFFITCTVRSKSSERTSINDKYLCNLEKEYIREIREYLHEQGFADSGVTMTCVVDGEGKREYKIVLHHKYLEKISVSEQNAILKGIKERAFSIEGCSFKVNLLT